jgi:signal transduction histidine kinase
LVVSITVVDYFIGINLSLAVVYLVPVSIAAAWFGARTAVAIVAVGTILRLAGDVMAVYPQMLPPYLWWNVIAGMSILAFVGWLVSSLFNAYRLLEVRFAARTSELATSVADRRRLELEVIEVASRERAAIGRELHDDLGQHLVATALAAQVLAHQLGTQRGGKEAQAIVRWIEDAIARTRKLARGLLIVHIEPERLVAELDELAKTASQTGVAVRVVQQGESPIATPTQCAQLYRIAQEAVGNALRHGQPKSIEVTLATDETGTCLIVGDDGAGFAPDQRSDGMGLRIMQHRAQMIGASFSVMSEGANGTKVICRLPLVKEIR